MPGNLVQHFPAQVPLEVRVSASALVPHALRQVRHPKLVREELTQREKEPVDGAQIYAIELLKIGQSDSSSGSPSRLQPSRQQRSFAHLSGTLDEDYAVATADRRLKLAVGWSHDVKLGIQRDGAAN